MMYCIIFCPILGHFVITIVKLLQLIIFFPKIIGCFGALIDKFLIFAPEKALALAWGVTQSWFCGAKIQKMWQTILISAGILLISFVFLAIKILFVKNGTFPKTHVSQSKAMRDRGIHCVQTQDFEDRHRQGLYSTSDNS